MISLLNLTRIFRCKEYLKGVLFLLVFNGSVFDGLNAIVYISVYIFLRLVQRIDFARTWRHLRQDRKFSLGLGLGLAGRF